jgi:hypothetical protein
MQSSKITTLPKKDGDKDQEILDSSVINSFSDGEFSKMKISRPPYLSFLREWGTTVPFSVTQISWVCVWGGYIDYRRKANQVWRGSCGSGSSWWPCKYTVWLTLKILFCFTPVVTVTLSVLVNSCSTDCCEKVVKRVSEKMLLLFISRDVNTLERVMCPWQQQWVFPAKLFLLPQCIVLYQWGHRDQSWDVYLRYRDLKIIKNNRILLKMKNQNHQSALSSKVASFTVDGKQREGILEIWS